MNIHEKLLNIQAELKAPKSQFNSFGKYNYRSCEDILEAVKPLCLKYKAVLRVHDEIVLIGDRYYIRATATLTDIEKDKNESITNTASAREAENKSGMDSSQITGTASSYARKYALNGLFCIDDTKDADTDAYKQQTTVKPKPVEPKITAEDVETAKQFISSYASIKNGNAEELEKYYLNKYKVKKLEDLKQTQGKDIINELLTLIAKEERK